MTISTHREYKSRIFIMLFREKEKLLELYNAVSGKHYTDPNLLTINTLENAIYMSMQNDISFVIDADLSLYEHQSTYNPNIPLRFLLYLSDLYSKLTGNMNLYGSKLLQIPAPHFVVFYNGITKRPEYEQMKLSNMYIVQGQPVHLELLVDVYNINIGFNEEMKEACTALAEYAKFTARVRQYVYETDELGNRIRSVDAAVEQAVAECIQENILRDFLTKHRSEVIHMSIYEYNQEQHIQLEREDAYEDGRAAGFSEGHSEGHAAGLSEGRAAGLSEGRAAGLNEGRSEGHAAGLSEGRLLALSNILHMLGEIPAEITARMDALTDDEILRWTLAAAKADSMEDFCGKILLR